MKKITVKDILEKKRSKERIVALSTYDFPFGKLVDESEIDIVLVGDSVGMVSLGLPSTLSVTMREMLHHTKAVSRAVKHALVVGDMPFGSYQDSPERAVRNGRRLIQEGGADAVKLEGGQAVLKQVRALAAAGISVMGHLGMTPQSATQLGGYKVQGRTKREAAGILRDALLLQKAGAFGVVLECIPVGLAKTVTKKLSIPTIGIGAGPFTDGQVLVLHDLLGFKSNVEPRFIRRYADLDRIIRSSIGAFRNDVLDGKFPSLEESFQ